MTWNTGIDSISIIDASLSSNLETKTLGNLEKIANFIFKNVEFRDIKMLKTNPLLLETMQCSIAKRQRTFRGP